MRLASKCSVRMAGELDFHEHGEMVGGEAGDFGFENIAGIDGGCEIGGDEKIINAHGGMGGGEGCAEVLGRVEKGVGVHITGGEDSGDHFAGELILLIGDAFCEAGRRRAMSII